MSESGVLAVCECVISSVFRRGCGGVCTCVNVRPRFFCVTDALSVCLQKIICAFTAMWYEHPVWVTVSVRERQLRGSLNMSRGQHSWAVFISSFSASPFSSPSFSPLSFHLCLHSRRKQCGLEMCAHGCLERTVTCVPSACVCVCDCGVYYVRQCVLWRDISREE